MGHRRRAKRKKHTLPDPAAVLEGRSDIGAQQLFELIHRVNPTGRELPAQDEARRYAQKSRLQSLLIQRFGDQHLEVREGEQEGVVSLEHRSGSKDACHAVLGELEPDARAWAQRRLDLETGDPDSPGDRSSHAAGTGSAELAKVAATEPRELVTLARREIDDFDYEAAEGHLRLALENSHGSVDAALPLLDLLVGVLGMDRQAIELEPQLAAGALTHPGVRASLALAAARLGESDHALRLIAGADTPRSAEVYAVLAAQAIRDNSPEVAGEYLDQARQHDPTHPQIPSLTQELAECQAEVMGPAEQTLERQLREAGALAVEAEARSLLARWPDSDVARRVLREVAGHRREAEVSKHLELADSALAEERFRDAGHHFQAAKEAGSDRPDLPELIEQTRQQERRRREQSQVDAVAESFERGEAKAALLAFLSLPESLRGRVREWCERPEIYWLEEIGPPSSRARAQAAVAAVLAFARARRDLRTAGAGAVLDDLKPHREVLHGVTPARDWLRDLESRLASELEERARQVLEDARGAHEATDLERAEGLLDGLDLDRLPRRDQARARRLRRSLGRSQERRLLEREYRHHLAADDVMGALERAHRLSEADGGAGGQEPWLRRIADLRRRVQSEWQVEETTDPLPLDELRDFQPRAIDCETPQIWLDDDGRELVLVDAWDRWLFIRAVDVASWTVTARISLRTPEPLGQFLQDICRDGEVLRIAGEKGYQLEIARDGWQILRWRSLRELLPEEAVIEQTRLIPASPYLWLAFRTRLAETWRCYVVDGRTWRIARKLPGEFVHPIPSSPPRVLSAHYEEGAKLYSARGRPGGEVRLPAETRVLAAAGLPATSPEAGGLWLVTIDLLEPEEEHAELLEMRPAADGSLETRSRFRIEEIYQEGSLALAALRDRKIGFLLLTTPDYGTELLALAGSRQGLQPLYRSPVPHGTMLVQDRHARQAIALCLGERSIAALALGLEPVTPTALGRTMKPRRDRRIPILRPPFFCDYPSGEKELLSQALVDQIQRSGRDAVRHRFEHQTGDPFATRADLCLALRRADPRDPLWASMARELAEENPEDPAAALLAAEAAAGSGQWDEVVRHLSQDPRGLDDGRACHFHHLLGVAYLHLGQLSAATAAFEEGLEYEAGTCALEPVLELARPMSHPPEPAEWGPDQSLVRQLLGTIRIADRCLERGDLEAARGVLERPAIRHAAEVQSAARLAEAHLRTPIDERSTNAGAERFNKRLACAFFLELQSARAILRKELDLPGLAWDKSRLDDVARRARAWLEEA